MANERWVYIDGAYLPSAEAKVSVFDHGYLYGDGVFEGIRAYHGRVFRLDEHLQRLYRSAQYLQLQIPIPPAEMRDAVLRTCARNGFASCYIRLVVSRGFGDLGIDPRKCRQGATVVIIASDIELFPPKVYDEGLEIITSSFRRTPPDSLNPNVKTLNYLNSIVAKMEATRAGAQEAILLDHNGYVTEGTGDNIFIYRDEELLTPPLYLGVLPGITRQAIIELASREELAVRERPFTMFDVYTSDEVFLTGTGAEIIPVVRADGRSIGNGKPGRVTLRLTQCYRELVSREGAPISLPEVMSHAD